MPFDSPPDWRPSPADVRRVRELGVEAFVDVTADYRSVYATILAGHLGADPEQILGGNFPLLGFLG